MNKSNSVIELFNKRAWRLSKNIDRLLEEKEYYIKELNYFESIDKIKFKQEILDAKNMLNRINQRLKK